MKHPAAIVEMAPSIEGLNVREARIVKSEDDADSELWAQASDVVKLIQAGNSQRQIAAGWINARTGEAYSHQHVKYVSEVCKVYFTASPRPRFRDAYNEIANRQPSKTELLKSSESNEWYTPAEYVEPVRTVMGGIDLDPASCKQANKTVRAATFYDANTDGLAQEWHGRVFCNPPYGGAQAEFAAKLLEEFQHERVKEAILLVNSNAAETAWFSPMWDHTLCFVSGRINYINPAGAENTSTHGSVFIYLGKNPKRFYQVFSQHGPVVRRWTP